MLEINETVPGFRFDVVKRFLSQSAQGVSCFFVLALNLLWGDAHAASPFQLKGLGVNPADFRVTTFATNLDFPVGMAQLADGSLLVAVSQGTSFGKSSGQILRLTDTNHNGIADNSGTVLFTGLPGGQTTVRMFGKLLFVTGQGSGKPISILRAGATPGAQLSLVGKINVNYPSGGWYHPHSALGIRPTPRKSGSCDLLFQLGSDKNFGVTTRTATISSTDIPGANGTIQGESIYMLTITDNITNVVATNLTQIARGLRNPAGFAFHPANGDLYFEDNGIDGLVDANEPLSADELNWIPAGQIGNGTVPDFGFPSNYVEYRTGAVIGGAGVQPLIAFQPLPDPADGSESEGPNDIAFAPPGFPDGLNDGIFVGFHGKWSLAGIANEENPLVYADLTTTNYFHFVSNDEPNIGHLDGLLSTRDSLFAADITSTGNIDLGGKTGVIYQIKSLVPRMSFRVVDNKLELSWTSGVLQSADSLSEQWSDVPEAAGLYTYSVEVNPSESEIYYRTKE